MILPLLAVAAMFAAPGAANAKAHGYRVLFVNGTDSSCVSTKLQSQLAAQPGVASVSNFNANAATPTAAMLDHYDMVVAVSDCLGYFNSAGVGNSLASYAKQGGVVVEYAFGSDTAYAPDSISGKWVSGGYSPYIAGTNSDRNISLGTHKASNPLFKGVTSLTNVDCDQDVKLAPGATSVARWNTGQQAIAYKGQAIEVNAGVDGICTYGGQYARLTLNAVKWRGPHALTVKKTGKGSGKVKSNPAGIKCGKTCSASYKFGKVVKLIASAAPGSTFAGWGGSCKGKKATCRVTMDAAKLVKAKFS